MSDYKLPTDINNTTHHQKPHQTTLHTTLYHQSNPLLTINFLTHIHTHTTRNAIRNYSAEWNARPQLMASTLNLMISKYCLQIYNTVKSFPLPCEEN